MIVEVRGEGSGRLRLKVLSDAGQKTLAPWVEESVEPGAIIHTDGWADYGRLASAGFDHRPRLQRRDHPDAQTLLPRAHRAVSNLKTWVQGTHRGVSPEHLPASLDEFVNRPAAPRWPPSRRFSAWGRTPCPEHLSGDRRTRGSGSSLSQTG